ncbi:MAG: hypothetical protein L3J25_05385 [Flavobacteriaceae bacterium]|nr:hypothetical protein [Flavobacteriaceae bacterium]
MKQYIEFKKQRELGDILSDTFAFIRYEFKPFLKTIFNIAGPYLLMFLIAMAFYLYTVGDIFDFSTYNQPGNEMFSFGLMFVSFAFIGITGILAYVIASSVALHYIKSYVKNKGNVNISDVKQDVKQTFWSFVGLGIIKWVVLIFAMMLCFLPVLYFMVPMAVMFSIFVFEGKDVSDSFSYSFKLIKDNYWITLLTIIVIGLIVTVAGYVFGLPAGIYSMVKMGIFSGEIDPANMNSFIDPVYIVLNILNYLANFLLNLISIIGSAFIYFNLNEKMNFTGTLERIESIGKNE